VSKPASESSPTGLRVCIYLSESVYYLERWWLANSQRSMYKQSRANKKPPHFTFPRNATFSAQKDHGLQARGPTKNRDNRNRDAIEPAAWPRPERLREPDMLSPALAAGIRRTRPAGGTRPGTRTVTQGNGVAARRRAAACRGQPHWQASGLGPGGPDVKTYVNLDILFGWK